MKEKFILRDFQMLQSNVGLSQSRCCILIKIINISKANVVLAPHPCGENCFCVIRDLSDCIDFS